MTFKMLGMIFLLFSSSSYALMNASSETSSFDKKSNRAVITGQQIADYMNVDYNNVVENCGSASRPAFLCSGVLFRATNPDTSYNSWDPSPASVSSGGVSFSFLRKDSKFSKLAYGYLNGFVLYPYSYAPDDKNTNIDILCAFPVDGGTDTRSEQGCGARKEYPTQSRPCQEQGITTGEGWAAHFLSVSNSGVQGRFDNRNVHQCGFTTRENSTYNGTAAFYQMIKGMAKIPDLSFKEQNELRLATWDTSATGYPNNFPIEAFFYIYKQNVLYTPIEKGLIGAQHDQSSYYEKTGIWVPVIRMSLPVTITEDASFSYSENDQKIPQKFN